MKPIGAKEKGVMSHYALVGLWNSQPQDMAMAKAAFTGSRANSQLTS